MLTELLAVREWMIKMLDSYSWKSQYSYSREVLKEVIINFDKTVLWAYLNSSEVNTKLLEELKFYEK